MGRSPSFGSVARHLSPFRTRVRSGSGCPCLNLATNNHSSAHSTKGTPSHLQGCSDWLEAHGFRLYFTPLAGVLFTVPSRYWFPIGRLLYLALGRGRPCFPPDSACRMVLTITSQSSSTPVTYGTLTPSGRPFQCRSARCGFRIERSVPRSTRLVLPPDSSAYQLNTLPRFGLLPFRSPLLRESSLFLGVLRCFSSPGAPTSIQRCIAVARDGLPHSDTPGSPVASSSPGLFAAWPRPSSAAGAKASTVRSSSWISLFHSTPPRPHFRTPPQGSTSGPAMAWSFLFFQIAFARIPPRAPTNQDFSRASVRARQSAVSHVFSTNVPLPVIGSPCQSAASARHQGGAAGTRTPDLRRARAALSQLSYDPIRFAPQDPSIPRRVSPSRVGAPGLEPGTSVLSGPRSNHLSYAPVLLALRSSLRRRRSEPCPQSHPHSHHAPTSEPAPHCHQWSCLCSCLRPDGLRGWMLDRFQVIPRKEVIQPQLPLRLPCYDFVPIIHPTLDGCPPCGLAHRLQVLPTFVT